MTSLLRMGEQGDVAVLHLDGEVDLADAERLRERILREVRRDDAGLVLDLSGCRYIDSAGVQMLFEVAHALEVQRRGFAIAVPHASPLRRLFAVTGLESVAAIVTGVDDGIDAIRRSHGAKLD